MSKKIFFQSILFFFLSFLAPIFIAVRYYGHPVTAIILFYVTNLAIFLYLLQKYSHKKYHLASQSDLLQEKINILNNKNSKELENNAGLRFKIIRYNNLKRVIEEINRNLDLESVADNLASIAFSLVANNRGTCILYLVDSKAKMGLKIFKAKKEDKKLVIRAKEGDAFDLWVLRHSTPLLVEDIKQDFRFDPEKLRSLDARPIGSLISSPFVSEHKFLGVLRLDNPQAHSFSQDDLRLLVTISDLGAVALENSELFQATQELAIHDSLTSLYTKGYFLERLKDECRRSIRHNTPLSLLMLDIDFFKNYNDQFGHAAGDIVLKILSQNITECLKKLNPVIGRFGGEEFCVILPGMDKKRSLGVACELRERIEKEKIILRRQETKITVSIGLAALPTDATAEDELIMKSDKAMYQAKQEGRNRVCSC